MSIPRFCLLNEHELQQHYQVSRVTIRKALKLLKDEGVISSQAGKKTQVNQKLQPLKAQESVIPTNNLIGFVMADFSDSFGAQLLKNLQSLVENIGYHLVVLFSNESKHREAENIKKLIQLNVAGILIFPIEREQKNREILLSELEKIPIVVLDRQLNDYALPFVGTDNYQISYTITKRLLQLGHENMLFLMQGSAKNTAIQNRIIGIQQAFYDSKKRLHEYNWLRINYHFTRRYGITQQLNHEVIKLHNHIQKIGRFTGFMALDFASGNILAVTLQPMKPTIKEKLSIVSFDGVPYSTSMLKSDYIIQDEATIAQQALQLLLSKIQQHKREQQTILIDAKYIDNFAVKQNEFTKLGARWF